MLSSASNTFITGYFSCKLWKKDQVLWFVNDCWTLAPETITAFKAYMAYDAVPSNEPVIPSLIFNVPVIDVSIFTLNPLTFCWKKTLK